VNDPNLYTGSARHYAVGRMPYPDSLAVAVRDALGLDGTGRLLDVGCGPGALTKVLAPHFASVVGVDADPAMVAEAERAVPGGTFRVVRAEDLPAGLGTFRVVSFAQSFHWMDQPLVAARVRPMIAAGGAWVHIGATTHRGVGATDRPVPWDEIEALVRGYVGWKGGNTRSGENDVMAAAGYRGPRVVEVPLGQEVERTPDEVVSAVFSLSTSTPYLLGERRDEFERDLRALLGPGPFIERRRDITAPLWWPPD
jgi:SAM-dependent methyltransferase